MRCRWWLCQWLWLMWNELRSNVEKYRPFRLRQTGKIWAIDAESEYGTHSFRHKWMANERQKNDTSNISPHFAVHIIFRVRFNSCDLFPWSNVLPMSSHRLQWHNYTNSHTRCIPFSLRHYVRLGSLCDFWLVKASWLHSSNFSLGFHFSIAFDLRVILTLTQNENNNWYICFTFALCIHWINPTHISHLPPSLNKPKCKRAARTISSHIKPNDIQIEVGIWIYLYFIKHTHTRTWVIVSM